MRSLCSAVLLLFLFAGPGFPNDEAPKEHQSPGVLVDGALAVPGADLNSQTRPAKFSAENDAQDKIPTMARGPRLTDEQKTAIAAALKQAPASANIDAAPTMELPVTAELREWPSDVMDKIPALRGTKYVRAADKILIVLPANRIVVGEIAEQARK